MFKINLWSKFWSLYDIHFNKTLWITFIILVMQIPHFLWAGDTIIQSGLVSGQNQFLDFFLYGIDLIEIPLIINTSMQVYSRYVRKLPQNTSN